MNFLWTLSNYMISDFECGDHTTELYSSIGLSRLTYTTNARTNILMSPDTK